MSHTHLIHNVNLDLNLQSDDNSLERANVLLEAYKNAILQIINSFFDEVNTDTTILIEHLEINIGDVENIEQLKHRLKEQLYTNLEQYLYKNNVSALVTAESKNEGFEKASLPDIAALLFFLESGKFKWDYHQIVFRDKEQFPYFEQLLLTYLDEISGEEFQQLVKLKPNIILRLLYYFPLLKVQIFQLIIPKWFSKYASTYRFIIEKLDVQIQELSMTANREEVNGFFAVLYFVHKQDQKPLLLLIPLCLIEVLTEITSLADFTHPSKITSLKSKLNTKVIQAIIERIYSVVSYKLEIDDILFFIDDISSNISSLSIGSTMQNNQDIQFRVSSPRDDVKYLKYCGVIFLHTYWCELFASLHLLENKSFIDQEAKIKAVYILYYLVTFKEVADEDDFEFFKLLVGIEGNLFIPPNFKLEKEEKLQCKIIIEKLIQEWRILKSTSIEIVQQNFLQRNGTLKQEERTIDIHLEKSGFDVLLDDFPANYSLIKLKWLDKLICVIL